MVQDKWFDNKRLSEQFMNGLKLEDKLDNYNLEIDSRARKNFSDHFLDKFKLDDRHGIYCGDINFEPEDKEGHLILEYLNYNPKIKKYEFIWRILFDNHRGGLLWEDIGEIEPEYIKEKPLSEIICSINKNVKEKIKQDTKLAIYDSEEYLETLIVFYQQISSFDEEEKDKLSEKLGIDKEKMLKGLESSYKIHLFNLKRLGGNISEYPKNLEDLTK
jgi:hypothetical protein